MSSENWTFTGRSSFILALKFDKYILIHFCMLKSFRQDNFVRAQVSILYIVYNCLYKVTNQVEIKVGDGEWERLINKRKIYWIMVLSEAGGQTIRY